MDRREWGLQWQVPLDTGGVLVSERVTMELEISAVKVPDGSRRATDATPATADAAPAGADAALATGDAALATGDAALATGDAAPATTDAAVTRPADGATSAQPTRSGRHRAQSSWFARLTGARR